MIAKVSENGNISLPPEFIKQDHVQPGQEFDVVRLDAGQYRLARRESQPEFDVVDWLLACPVKGFFVPIPSESTDDL